VPIPSEHLDRLEAELSGHEGWLRTLRRQIEALEAEASAHEMILRLGRDSNLRRFLDELHDQPDLARRIAEDPRSFLEKQGIELPDGAVVTVRTDPEQAAVEARFDDPPIYYGVGWSRAVGFYVIQGQGFAPEPESSTAPNREGG
jgi:xanthine/CO dehydrogenase XdhC/CoxF family maturation factor